MLKITKAGEPEFFSDFKRKVKPKNWDDYTSHHDVKTKLRDYMLENEQDGYCPYCEKRITNISKSHIEHIKPKGNPSFQEEFQEYHNLIVSCNSKKTCGTLKKDQYSEDFINPVLDNPKEFLTYNIDTGAILSKKGNSREEVTIRILNLNHDTLKESRKAFSEELGWLKGNSKEEFQKNLAYYTTYNFKTLLELHLEIY